jgi:hypothetical protein
MFIGPRGKRRLRGPIRGHRFTAFPLDGDDRTFTGEPFRSARRTQNLPFKRACCRSWGSHSHLPAWVDQRGRGRSIFGLVCLSRNPDQYLCTPRADASRSFNSLSRSRYYVKEQKETTYFFRRAPFLRHRSRQARIAALRYGRRGQHS